MPAFTKILLGGQPVLDADRVIEQLALRPHWADEINSLTCATGAAPGKGAFLMAKQHFDLVNSTGPVSIAWTRDDGDGSAVTLTFSGYVITRAYAAVQVKDSPYVVHVADLRQIYARSAAMLRFNVRAAVGDSWDANSLNSGTPHTWQEVVEALRDLLPGTTGDALALPTPPSTTPENLVFEGMSAWDALAMIADMTGHAISYDPIAGTPVYIDHADTPSPTFASQKSSLLILQDLLPATTAHGIAPEKVRFCYRWRVDEESSVVPRKPFTVELDTNITNAVGTEIRWGDMLAEPDLNDIDSDPTNKTAIELDADELLLSYLAELNSDVAPQSTTIIGLHDFRPNAEVESVTWRVHQRDTRTTVRIAGQQVGKTYLPPTISPGPYFVLIPSEGFAAATDDGATPSVTECELYKPGNAGALVACVDASDNPATVLVRHYGSAITEPSGFLYARIHWCGTGWMLDVAYCD